MNKRTSKFGERLRQLRRAADVTLDALSESTGVSITHLSCIERGSRSAPHDSVIVQLAMAIGCMEHLDELRRLARDETTTLRINLRATRSQTVRDALFAVATAYRQGMLTDAKAKAIRQLAEG
jgi:transcriptional regulator with XRE-family HTH domain